MTKALGPYRIENRLATGGMAEVYVAHRVGAHGFEKRVALKRILPQYARDPDFVAMFIAEARLAARLEHPNIVQVFDFGEYDGELFIAMELVDGTNVNRLLRAVSAREDVVPLDVALHIASETAHALAYAHNLTGPKGEEMSFVHRDVSPANILLTRTGHVKLTDFGIARVADMDLHTDEGHVRGKLGYMSPEQVTGKELDGRSDVFTLAIVLSEMMIGEPLFGKEGSDLDILLRIRDVDLSVLASSKRRIPQDVHALVTSGLARNPDRRPSASAYAEAIEEVIRRRGVGYAPEKLARLLVRQQLVSSDTSEAGNEPGGRITEVVDTTGLSEDVARMVGRMAPTSPAIYRVRLSNGEEKGPMSFPRLVQMVTSGLVRSETMIAKEGADFNPATELPELTRFVTSPALQWRPEEITKATHRGEIYPGRVLQLAHRVLARRETGVFHLDDGTRRKKIYYFEGRPEFIASTDKSELLGEHLVATSMCMRMELDMALALLPRYGGRLGDALVGIGVLRPIELFRAIAGQVRRKYLEAFRWRAGDWFFVPGVRSHEETFPLGQDPHELLRDAVVEAPDDELEIALSGVVTRTIAQVPRPALPLSSYRVPDAWHRVIAAPVEPISYTELLARGEAWTIPPRALQEAVLFGLACGFLRAE